MVGRKGPKPYPYGECSTRKQAESLSHPPVPRMPPVLNTAMSAGAACSKELGSGTSSVRTRPIPHGRGRVQSGTPYTWRIAAIAPKPNPRTQLDIVKNAMNWAMEGLERKGSGAESITFLPSDEVVPQRPPLPASSGQQPRVGFGFGLPRHDISAPP